MYLFRLGVDVVLLNSSLVLVIVWIIQETAKLFEQIIFENGQVFVHCVIFVFLLLHQDEFFQAEKIVLLFPPHISLLGCSFLFQNMLLCFLPPLLFSLVHQLCQVEDPAEWWREGRRRSEELRL